MRATAPWAGGFPAADSLGCPWPGHRAGQGQRPVSGMPGQEGRGHRERGLGSAHPRLCPCGDRVPLRPFRRVLGPRPLSSPCPPLLAPPTRGPRPQGPLARLACVTSVCAAPCPSLLAQKLPLVDVQGPAARTESGLAVPLLATLLSLNPCGTERVRGWPRVTQALPHRALCLPRRSCSSC